jgi:hypothetical protein
MKSKTLPVLMLQMIRQIVLIQGHRLDGRQDIIERLRQTTRPSSAQASYHPHQQEILALPTSWKTFEPKSPS